MEENENKGVMKKASAGYQKAQEGYKKTKDTVYKAENFRSKTESTAVDMRNTANAATGFIGWLKNLLHLQ